MKQLLILFGFLMLFIACETPLYFEEPQKKNSTGSIWVNIKVQVIKVLF
ncbi:MAG: hypothetical protein ACJAUH_002835 [Saprospiraceae bacterium]|jgi:hypothetical protein